MILLLENFKKFILHEILVFNKVSLKAKLGIGKNTFLLEIIQINLKQHFILENLNSNTVCSVSFHLIINKQSQNFPNSYTHIPFLVRIVQYT